MMSSKEDQDVRISFSHEFQECLETVCEPCSESGSLLKAEGYCINCNEFLCQTCIQYHKRLKMSKDHKILGPDEMPRTKPSFAEERDRLPSMNIHNTECKLHNRELIEFYCKDHKTVLCAVCVPLFHLSCQKIQRVVDVSIEEDVRNELERFSQRLNDSSEKLCTIIQTTGNNHLHVKERKETLLFDIRMYKENAIETINRLANALEISVEKMTIENHAQLDQRLKHCTTLQKHTEIMCRESKDLQENDQKEREFIWMNQSEHQLEILEKNICDMMTDTLFKNYVFCSNIQLRLVIEKKKELGQLVEETETGKCDSCKTMGRKAQLYNMCCGHFRCRICINGSINDGVTCSVCGKVSGNQPDGSTRDLNKYNEKKNILKVEFIFPDGIQKLFHPRPGERYTGTTLTCFLPKNDEGKKILGMLKTAFNQKLLSKIEDDQVRANIELCDSDWISSQDLKRLTIRLGELGITA